MLTQGCLPARRPVNRAALLAATVVVALAGCGDGDDTGPSSPPESQIAAEAGVLEVEVDRRVELLSVLFRLAGAEPYRLAATPYARAADQHFAPFADHPAVAESVRLVAEHGISYDAVVELAVYLDDELRPAAPLEPLPPGLDPRWRGVDIESYLAKVRDFAAESAFEAFLKAQGDYHDAVEAAFAGYLAGRPVIEWFDKTLGELPSASYRAIPGLLTGGHGFGVSAEPAGGGVEVSPILFLESPDLAGVPQPTTLTLEYLAHELAHPYVNPIFDARVREMRSVAEPLFRQVEEQMRGQAYTSSSIMVNESVVRALTVVYLRQEVSEDEAQRSLAEQERLSFRWTAELAEAIADELERAGSLEPGPLFELTRRVLADAA
jgi:hypothetical protein